VTDRGGIVAVAAALLAGALGCGDATIDVGPAAPSDPCEFWGGQGCPGPRAAVTGQISYQQDGSQNSASSVDAFVIGPVVTMTGKDTAEISLTVWAQGTGVFRCEDPATANRTYIRMLVAQQHDTTSGGTCAITISRFPTAADPRLEGTFVAGFNASGFAPASKLEGGSFSLSDVTRF